MNQSYAYTFVIQLCFCLAFYLVFQIGQPHKAVIKTKVQRSNLDFHFITVLSTPRPFQEDALLLKQLHKVIKMYNVHFVINISDHPVLMNVTAFLQQPEVHSSTARSLKGQEPVYYHKKIDLPHGRTLDITVINTKSFQDLLGPDQKNQFSSLTTRLKGSHSDWRIAVGYHSIVNCSVDREKSDRSASEQLYHTLLNTGVNAYLSGQTCPTYGPKESSIGIGSGNFESKALSFTSLNQQLMQREIVDGFLLHRISALEFVSYLVNVNGDVVRAVALQPKGKESM